MGNNSAKQQLGPVTIPKTFFSLFKLSLLGFRNKQNVCEN